MPERGDLERGDSEHGHAERDHGERGHDERGEPIDRPEIYRALVFAFVVWAAHFSLSYAAVLIFPGQDIARIAALLAGIAAAAALVWRGGKLTRPRSPLALGALGLALAGVTFGTFPAIVG